MYRIALLLLPAIAMLLAGCSASAERTPVLHRVRPLTVTPGGLLLVTGESLDRVATLSIGGQLATNITVVNPAVLTAVAPAELDMGPQPLELKAYDGSVIGGSVTVAQPPPTPTPTRTPSPTRTPPPARTPSRPASPTPSPSPSRSPAASPSARPAPPRIIFPPWIDDDDDERDPPGRRRGQ